MYCTMYYFMLSCVVKTLFLKKEKKILKKKEKEEYKIMFGLIKNAFIALLSFSGYLAGMVRISYWTRYISLNNQPCMTRPDFIDLNPDEYNQGLPYG